MRLLCALIVFAFLSIGSIRVSCAQSQQEQPAQSQPQQQPSQPQDQQQSQGTQSPQGQETAPPPASNAAPPAPPTQQPAQGATPSQASSDTDHPVLKRRPVKKPVHKKTGAKTSSGKVIVRNGGAQEGTPQLSPGVNNQQQGHDRESTDQLLATTDANLKAVAGRQLSTAQQSMVEQIHTYIAQSKAASNSGDLNRAHTLAFKAHLLSDELAKK